MPDYLGDRINHARRARRLTLRQLSAQIRKEDGESISPQYLNDIELNRRIPSTHVLQELARTLDLDLDTLLTLARVGETVMREYLEEHPQQEAEVIQLFRAAQQRGFKDWQQLRKIIEQRRTKKDRE
jgi:transcriptional regulator with XRE-family HTH domain